MNTPDGEDPAAGRDPRPDEELAPVTEGDGPSSPSLLRKALVWGERILWVAVLGFLAVRLAPQAGALLGVGPALGSLPAFELTTLEGEPLSAEDLRGRVAVVNFWATWCPPCRLEIPALQSLREDYEEDELVVVGISTDVGTEAEIRSFLEERGVTYPVARATPAVRRAFGGVSALPTTFILDRDGEIRHRVLGFFAPPAMRAAVSRLLDDR